MTPTARSLAMLRQAGAMAEVVEQTIRRKGGRVFKRDLFSCIDIVSVWPDARGVAGIQTTSGDHVSHRLEKMREPKIAANVIRWLEAGNTLTIHGWAKRGPRGKRKTWMCRVVAVRLEDVMSCGAPLTEP